jgi:hypothetical protein
MPIYNPFRPNGIVSPGMFSGRLDEIKSIEHSLFQPKHDNPQHFLIEGERGIGKSSLMLYVDWVAQGTIPGLDESGRYKFLVVSVELDDSCDYRDIIRKVGADLKRALGEKERVKELAGKSWDFLKNWEVLGVKYKQRDIDYDNYELLDLLTETLVGIVIDAKTKIDGVLILIDEADKASEAAGLGGFAKLLTERLTKRGCSKVILGLAGLPNLIPKLRASHESAPRVFEALTLEPLEPEERIAVIQSGLAEAREKNGFETVIDADAKQLISGNYSTRPVTGSGVS